MKVWDIRNFKDEPLHQYFTPTPATCLDLSQRNMLAVGHGLCLGMHAIINEAVMS
jgi:U3 small nucleolar RNA-associated protein 7